MLVASDTVERSPAAVVGQDTAERVNTLLAGRWAGSPRRFLISTYALAKAPQLLYLAGHFMGSGDFARELSEKIGLRLVSRTAV